MEEKNPYFYGEWQKGGTLEQAYHFLFRSMAIFNQTAQEIKIPHAKTQAQAIQLFNDNWKVILTKYLKPELKDARKQWDQTYSNAMLTWIHGVEAILYDHHLE